MVFAQGLGTFFFDRMRTSRLGYEVMALVDKVRYGLVSMTLVSLKDLFGVFALLESKLAITRVSCRLPVVCSDGQTCWVNCHVRRKGSDLNSAYAMGVRVVPAYRWWRSPQRGPSAGGRGTFAALGDPEEELTVVETRMDSLPGQQD